MTRRVLLALLLPLAALAALLGAATPAHACSCVPMSWQALDRSGDAVFVATMGDYRVAQSYGPLRGRRWDALVESVYQGDVAPRTTVVAPADPSACGILFRPGERYLVVTTGGGAGSWTTSLCTGTDRIDGGDLQQVERVLGPPQAPRGPISAPGPIVYGEPGTIAPELAVTAAVREALALLLAPVLGPADA